MTSLPFRHSSPRVGPGPHCFLQSSSSICRPKNKHYKGLFKKNIPSFSRQDLIPNRFFEQYRVVTFKPGCKIILYFQPSHPRLLFYAVLLYTVLHSVLFVQYVFIQTEQAETYPKIYVSIDNSTFFCPSLFGWKEKIIFEETLNSKL